MEKYPPSGPDDGQSNFPYRDSDDAILGDLSMNTLTVPEHVGWLYSPEKGINQSHRQVPPVLGSEMHIKMEEETLTENLFLGGEMHIKREEETLTESTLDANGNHLSVWCDLFYFDNGFDRKQEYNNPDVSVSDGNSVDCSGCILLREIVHSNGVEKKILKIHGEIGKYCHALFESQYIFNGFSHSVQQSYMDLSQQNPEGVKNFLTDYCLSRVHGGFQVVHDSVHGLIDALSVPTNIYAATKGNGQEDLADSGRGPTTTSKIAEMSETEPSTASNKPTTTSKIAAQRKRAGNLGIEQLLVYFHLPIEKAAKELDLCVTVLKKICRKHGMGRWPYRKLNGIARNILKLEERMHHSDGDPSIELQIKNLRDQRARIYECIPPKFG